MSLINNCHLFALNSYINLCLINTYIIIITATVIITAHCSVHKRTSLILKHFILHDAYWYKNYIFLADALYGVWVKCKMQGASLRGDNLRGDT